MSLRLFYTRYCIPTYELKLSITDMALLKGIRPQIDNLVYIKQFLVNEFLLPDNFIPIFISSNYV